MRQPRRPPHPAVEVVRTLPAATAELVRAVMPMAELDLSGVVVKVKRHGIRRAWFRSCDRAGCPLPGRVSDGYAEGEARGPGHLYARKRDLAHCRSERPVVTVDRTSHWVTGRAYDGIPHPAAVPRGSRYLVTLKVPVLIPDGHLPADRTYHRAKTAGATHIQTPADDLVFVLGHELTHVDQFRTGRTRSEVEAERAGRRILGDWVAAGRPGMLDLTPTRAASA